MKIDATIQIEMPSMPNFLKGRFGHSIDDAHDTITIDVAQLTPEGVEQFLESYCESFRKHWKERGGS